MAKERKLLDLEDHVFALEQFDDDEQDLKDRVYQKLQERIEFDPRTECCIYTGAWEDNGQAKMRVNGRVYCVSRLAAWVFYKGFQLWGTNRAIRDCASPACCNPEHIFVVKDLAEALAAQRNADRFGSKPGRLTRAAAEDIRVRYARKEATMQELADEHGVRVPAVRAVLLGRTWPTEGGAS